LNEFSYDADVAGLGYSLSRDTDGLFLAAYGFDDQLHVLLAKLVQGMRNHVVKKERFDVIKDSLVRQLQNWKLNAPYDHAINYTEYLLTSRQWTNEEKEEALKGSNPLFPIVQVLISDIQAQDVQQFIPELLSNLHIETLIHGNATKEDALKLTRIVEENLGAKPLDFESVEGTRSLLLPTGYSLSDLN
jgi:insulysin